MNLLVSRIILDQRVFSYAYLEVAGETVNLSMQYTELPLDLITSLYCGVSYIVLFAYIIKSGSQNDSVGRRELRYCVQFLLMFLTYTVAWVTFFAYPAIGIKAPEAYVITPAVVVLNGGVNSFIYLLLNKEIQCAANNLLGMKILRVEPSTNERNVWKTQVQPSAQLKLSSPRPA